MDIPRKQKMCANKTADTKDKNGNPIKRYGWGIGQIDKGAITNGPGAVTTAEVWNWRTNVLSAIKILKQKRDTYVSFTNYFRMTYPNTYVPPPTNHPTLPMTTEQFVVSILYNGVDEITIPKSTVWKGSKEGDIWSPIVFVPQKGIWTFHDNNKKYGSLIAKELHNPTPAKE